MRSLRPTRFLRGIPLLVAAATVLLNLAIVDPFGWSGGYPDPWEQHVNGARSWCMWADGEWADRCGGVQNPLLAPTERSTLIVDDTDTNGAFAQNCNSGSWSQANAGYNARMLYTGVKDAENCRALWQPTLSQAGIYEIQVYIPSVNATSWQAKYTVNHANGKSTALVDQYGLYDRWVSLGVYRLHRGNLGYARISDFTGEPSTTNRLVGADAVRFINEDGVYYDDASPSVSYTGSWTHSSLWDKTYANTVSWSNAVGSRALLNFSGSRITRLYTMASNRGSETIRIDGASRGTTSSYAWETRWQAAKTWSLSPGSHTIQVEVAGGGGGYSDLDAFVVDLPAARSGTSYDDPHYQLNSIGGWTHGTGWSSAYGGTVS